MLVGRSIPRHIGEAGSTLLCHRDHWAKRPRSPRLAIAVSSDPADQNSCARLMQLGSAALSACSMSQGIGPGWSRLMLPASLPRVPHNPKVAGSDPAPATNFDTPSSLGRPEPRGESLA